MYISTEGNISYIHLLPVKARILYKMCVLVSQALKQKTGIINGVDREKSAVFKELTQSFRTYELRGQAKKKNKKSSNRIKDKQVPHTLLQKLSKKKKLLTESKTNKYLTLSYKNYQKKKSSNRIKDKQVPHTLLQKLSKKKKSSNRIKDKQVPHTLLQKL